MGGKGGFHLPLSLGCRGHGGVGGHPSYRMVFCRHRQRLDGGPESYFSYLPQPRCRRRDTAILMAVRLLSSFKFLKITPSSDLFYLQCALKGLRTAFT